MKPSFKPLLEDPRIKNRSQEFLSFIESEGITDPEDAKRKFKDRLGLIRVYRGLCMEEGSTEYRRVFEDRTLVARISAREADLRLSLAKAERIGILRGVLARLNQPGTVYDDGDFIFSVSPYPEPQVLPAAARLTTLNKVYLLHFDMPLFDTLNISIADITKTMPRNPYLFRYRGVLFNGSDPNVELFVAHKTHLHNLTSQSFSVPEDVLAFCRPYKERMEQEFGLLYAKQREGFM